MPKSDLSESSSPWRRTKRRTRWSRGQVLVGVLSLSLVLTMLNPLAPPPAQAANAGLPGVNVQPPFVGVWDKFGVASPSSHHIVAPGGSDWSVDLYAPSGTPVQARAWPVSRKGAIVYRIAEVQGACKNASDAGGQAVKVDFIYNGDKIGHAWYLHLDRVAVQKNTEVKHGATLGYTKLFRRSNCYDVPKEDGVHVHFELKSAANNACYLPSYKRGSKVEYWGVLGRIGGDFARQPQAACPG